MSVLYTSSLLPSIPFPLVFPTADGHLGFSQSPVTVATTVMNILALAFWWACAPFLLDRYLAVGLYMVCVQFE